MEGLWGMLIVVGLLTGSGGLLTGLIVGHYTGRRAERKYVTDPHLDNPCANTSKWAALKGGG